MSLVFCTEILYLSWELWVHQLSINTDPISSKTKGNQKECCYKISHDNCNFFESSFETDEKTKSSFNTLSIFNLLIVRYTLVQIHKVLNKIRIKPVSPIQLCKFLTVDIKEPIFLDQFECLNFEMWNFDKHVNSWFYLSLTVNLILRV